MAVRAFSMGIAILVLSLFFSTSLEAQIYKWVDDNGTTHYSDQHLGVNDYDWVDESDLIIYLDQPAKVYKQNNDRVLPAPFVPRKTVQRKRKVRRDTGQTRVGGSSSSRNYRGGSSLRRSSGSRY